MSKSAADAAVIDRTRKMLYTNEAVRERVTYNAWCARRGTSPSAAERVVFDDLSPERRRALWFEARAELEAYWALSPRERQRLDSASLQRTLDRNAARCDAIVEANGAVTDSAAALRLLAGETK